MTRYRSSSNCLSPLGPLIQKITQHIPRKIEKEEALDIIIVTCSINEATVGPIDFHVVYDELAAILDVNRSNAFTGQDIQDLYAFMKQYPEDPITPYESWLPACQAYICGQNGNPREFYPRRGEKSLDDLYDTVTEMAARQMNQKYPWKDVPDLRQCLRYSAVQAGKGKGHEHGRHDGRCSFLEARAGGRSSNTGPRSYEGQFNRGESAGNTYGNMDSDETSNDAMGRGYGSGFRRGNDFRGGPGFHISTW